MQSTAARPFRTRHLIGAFAFLGLMTAAACGDGADDTKGNGNCGTQLIGCGDSCDSPTDCSQGLTCTDGKCAPPSYDEDDCKADFGAYCGEECDQQSDCAAGLHCDLEGLCAAECKDAADCGNGKRCTADGRCVAGPIIDPGGGGGEGGGSGCINEDVTFQPQTPTVMLLVDRSGSMNEVDSDNFDDAPAWTCDASDNAWRWNVARYVLMHPTEGVVKPLEGKVRFGQTLYSGDDSNTCPELSGVVQPALNNHAKMLDAFPCSSIQEDTPTGPALDAVVEQLAAFNEPGPKIIVIATDGEPDDCECPDFGNQGPPGCDNAKAQAVKDAVVAKAQAAHDDEGITVHTILIAQQTDGLWEHVQAVAKAGGGSAFEANDVEGMKNAFSTIVNGARSCIIELDGSISSGKESEGTVVLNGSPLTLNDDNGWKVNSPSQIELLGDACEVIKDPKADPSLKIDFPCGSYMPDIK